MAERFQGVSERTVELALAVNPYDERTGTPLRDAAAVSVDGVAAAPRLNPSGYWLFLSPPATLDASVSVTVEAPPQYANRTVTVDTTQSPPAERIPLYPSTAASFSPGSTTVQGRVTENGAEALPDATVSIEHTDLVTRTDTDGTFVLEIRGIATTESAGADDPLRVDPSSGEPTRIRVHPDTGPPETPTLVADHPDHAAATRPLPIDEGERKRLSTQIDL
jgi:hypothetical protein